ncbi:hypothetical protein BH10CHL1_BH10CHL1_45690 [soil metagenome]
MQAPLPIAGPLTLGDLLDRAFRIYRARFGLFILTGAIFLVPLGILSGLLSGNVMTNYLNFLTQVMQNPEVTPDQTMRNLFQSNNNTIYLTYLLLPLSLVINVVVNLALMQQCIAILHNQEVSLGSSLRVAMSRFWAYLGMTIVKWLGMIFAMGVALLPLICIFFAAVFASVGGLSLPTGNFGRSEFFQTFGIIALVCCGYVVTLLLMITPLVYLGGRWVVATPGLIEQRWGPVEALRNSWALTKGQVRRCVLYVALIYVLYFVVYGMLNGLAYAALAATWVAAPKAGMVVFSAVNAILPVLWQPLASAAFVMLYYDLRVRQEGYDLNLRVQQLEAEVQPVRGNQESASS